MQINKNNYLKLKRLLIDDLINDVNLLYQFGPDPINQNKIKNDFSNLNDTLACFGDEAALEDLNHARQLVKQIGNADAEDLIDSWLDRINLD